MSDKTPGPERVPQWPKFSAVLHDDGTGELTINGASEPIAAADVNLARGVVLSRVATYARDELHRPVRLHTTDPDGQWELAVHPNGDVDELAGQPTAAAPPLAPAVRMPRRREKLVTPPATPRRGARPPRRRLIEAAAAILVLAAAIAAVVVLTSGSDTASVGPTVSTATPTTTVAPGAVTDIIDAARAKAAAHDAAIAKARHQRFVRRQAAARRRAVERRVARKRAAAKRRAQARAAARARARARRQAATRPPAPVVPPRPVTPPPPPPPPAQSPVCQEFPPC
jgi:hypothetical protein